MKKYALVLSLSACVAVPGLAAGQGVGVAARVGTLGLGGEAAVGFADRVVIRGGFGYALVEPTATFDDLDVTLDLPNLYNVGLDFYLNGAFRLGGGILFRSRDPKVAATFDTPQDIGGTSFTPQELGTLTGVIASRDPAPYVLLGFGKHTDPRIGLFVDLGVAFLGDPTVSLGASGGTLSDQSDPLRSALDREAESFENDMRTYLRIWPILSLGLRVGLGRSRLGV